IYLRYVTLKPAKRVRASSVHSGRGGGSCGRMKGFKLDKCQRRCESRDDGQNGCRYRDSERERPICSLRHYSSPRSPNSGVRNNSEQGRLYGDEASRAATAALYPERGRGCTSLWCANVQLPGGKVTG